MLEGKMTSDEQRAKWRAKYRTHADVQRARARAYAAAHREERSAYAKKRRQTDPEAVRANKARYRACNRELLRQQNRDYLRRIRKERPELAAEWRRRQARCRRERARPRQWVAAMLTPFIGQRGRRACVRVYKASKGCTDCGIRDADVLEFDHLPGKRKRFTINNGRYIPGAALWKEIAKCEVVCANCHRKRTKARRKSPVW